MSIVLSCEYQVDLPKELLEKLNIAVVHMYVSSSEKTYRDDEMPLADFYALARKEGKIAKDEKFAVINYPRPKSLSEKISDLLFKDMISVNKIAASSGVDIRYLNLFKRLQYDTVLLPFEIKM